MALAGETLLRLWADPHFNFLHSQDSKGHTRFRERARPISGYADAHLGSAIDSHLCGIRQVPIHLVFDKPLKESRSEGRCSDACWHRVDRSRFGMLFITKVFHLERARNLNALDCVGRKRSAGWTDLRQKGTTQVVV